MLIRFYNVIWVVSVLSRGIWEGFIDKSGATPIEYRYT